MGSSERLHLRWNDFESNIKLGFSELRKEEEFFDVTLACGSKQIKAHKVILSACSPFFRSIIKSVPHQHPLLYLRGIKFNYMESLLCFMYNGEVNVTQEELKNFLAVAEELKIKGLSQNQSLQSPSINEEAHLPPNKRPRIVNKVDLSSPRANITRENSSPVISKESTCQTHVSSKHYSQPTITIEDDEIQDITPITEDKKYVVNNSMTIPDKPQEVDDSLHKEEFIEDQNEYESASGDFCYDEEESITDHDLSGAPGPSGTSIPLDENKELNEKLNAEINRLIKRTPDGVYQCISCKKTTKRLQNLQFHIESMHVITDGFECHLCGTILKTRQYYQKHMKKHERSPKYIQTR
ncbi:uncharacterized protein [Lepeophtheirus salmonis]|uniref:uncharacterized protein isoform X1 n=1 Tax=Lepeophtheirus salmonis TaxID=72036 RepID=UPI001AE3F2FD|nr:zinc finger protein 131-like isoform X1 [Lepeophtheirus salmonis]